ncbi:serine/threonine-protein kinase-like protein 8 [Elsinoe australis]|uniref:non-specific serine/threonine protein kinase n=1 Tax=Elsinoe australis TaxID=40998 RepID=A0A4U7AUS3_9PEZI|nr:serine/threonine-protein kinase-like protein 8 [Elsinoe australis]
MNGDLSLSGSLGGLRIANPDDDDTTAASNSPPTTETERSIDNDTASIGQHSSSTVRDLRQESTISSDSTALNSLEGGSADTQSYPQDAERQQQSSAGYYSHANHAPTEYENLRRMNPGLNADGGRQRPVSAIYNHSNTSSSSNVSARDTNRYAGDMMAQQQINISRSASRSASHPMGPTGDRYPSRQPSQRDRYRQSQQYPPSQYAVSSGMVPPRRASQRIPAHHQNSSQVSQTAGAPYSVEGGPLPSSEEWKDRGAAVSTRQEIDANGNPVQRVVKKGVKDFQFGRTLGEGSYSTVLGAHDRQTGREYAIKVLDKRHIIKEKKVKYVNIEKDTLNRLTEHPGIVRLYYTFQDERSLYFVLDLAAGGELLGVLKKTGTFDVDCTRFYAAQILDSISYMHSKGVIHRDLKPENVLLDNNMHTKITDFGTAKILNVRTDNGANDASGHPLDGAETDRAQSFVGTAEYVSPELLTDKNACKASDLWAFGCIVFQLLAGRPPFKASNEYQTFQKIVALDYQFPDGFPPTAKDLIQRLLVLDPARRLPIEHIKNHEFFDGVQWGKGLWRMRAPNLRPYVPPAKDPIRLNGGGANVPPANSRSQGTSPAHTGAAHTRPQLRAVTELPPPSQLDIDWSPVLTRPNERILKMGNLVVTSLPFPQSPQQGSSADTPKKFSRFFGGGTTKKKQRLVMVTSTARIIVVPAGGDEKKAKMELPLMQPGVICRDYVDPRGLTAFCVEIKDKQFTFEDPRASTSDPDGSKYSTKEWMEKIDWAKELAASQSVANSYSADSQYSGLGSAIPTPNSAAASDLNLDQTVHTRGVLRRDGDNESLRSRKNRFSKRHSKSGLAAVF